MRTAHRPARASILPAAAFVAAAVAVAASQGQDPAVAPQAPAASSTIGSHQIDRYEAIRQLQLAARSDPNNVANWVILGELAHEVALDLPQEQDDPYYKLSRDAYERALALDPANNGLKAAVQFAREQEANAPTFDAQRRRGVATYLDARRREMAQNGVNPTVLVYETPTPLPSTLPAAQPPQRTQPTPITAGQPRPGQAPTYAYPTPTYRPYYNPQGQQPYGYNQYSDGYAPPAANAAQAPPTTLRQFGQQLPGLLLNDAARGLNRPGAPR